ncbi:MAG: MotA/TolQ/ExbB proton channel family protein [Pseudomonadota bacterium]
MEYLSTIFGSGSQGALEFLNQGGIIVWAIGLLSVITLTTIIWKALALAGLGAWSGGSATEKAVTAWQSGRDDEALSLLADRNSTRASVARAAIGAVSNPAFHSEDAEREIMRVAKARLGSARSGLKLLELIATIAPLLGLLGTVVGMIAAFQALQEAGARADPSTLAGGIWEALLTTAAGMAVAIPATMALTYFESVVDRLRRDLEDIATRILLPRKGPKPLSQAAE